MKNYLALMERVLTEGRPKGDRTGKGTRSVFSAQLEYDLRLGFPLMTSRFLSLRLAFVELIWFLRGHTNAQELEAQGCYFWSNFALKAPSSVAYCQAGQPDRFEFYDTGETNAPYGPNWRRFGGCVDQIHQAVELLRTNPDSRRIVISAWDPLNQPDESKTVADNIVLGKPCLMPCHFAIQLYTEEMSIEERTEYVLRTHFFRDHPDFCGEWVPGPDLETRKELFDAAGVPKRYLDLKWNQRSVDLGIGCCTNVASYALLQSLFAHHLGFAPRYLVGDLTNVHLYNDQLPAATEQLTRPTHDLPTLKIKPVRHADLSEYNWDDLELIGYNHSGKLQYPQPA